MGSPESIWDNFHLDENCVTVTGDSKIRVYFSQIRRALAALEHSVEQGTSITNAERRAINEHVERLRNTFEILALRHFYSEVGPDLKLDRRDSGFVHFSALLELAADLSSRDEALAGVPDLEAQKRRLLDDVLRGVRRPREHQVSMLRRLYLESLAEGKIARTFASGRLEKVGRSDDEASYFWSFSTYDRALNRPFVYLIYFAWDGGRKPLDEDAEAFAELRAAAEHAAGGRMSLLAFSNRLDDRVVRMSPRIVKRLVLGPYSAPGFTNTEGPFGDLLTRLDGRLPFALRWESETLISQRETRVGGGWLTKGQLRQVFWVPKDLDLSARGVSQLERFVLLPHWLAQHVREAGLLSDHHHIPIEEEGADRVDA